VVVFDPRTDIAVLYVPGLPLRPLGFGTVPDRGGDVVALGYPNDGPLTASAGRVRGIINAAGEDIYGNATVTRQVIAIRAVVRPGNSGGPLVDVGGQVVGVVFAASVDDPETGYALTVQEVAAAAAAGRTRTAAVSTGPCA
jgi:S1-C subfamily serine protease